MLNFLYKNLILLKEKKSRNLSRCRSVNSWWYMGAMRDLMIATFSYCCELVLLDTTMTLSGGTLVRGGWYAGVRGRHSTLQRACSSHYRHNRPGFNTCHSLADSRVFLHVYRAIDWSVPNWGFVGPVDHVDLDLNGPGQDLLPSILGYGLQAIALSLEVIRVLEVSRECRDIKAPLSVETNVC